VSASCSASMMLSIRCWLLISMQKQWCKECWWCYTRGQHHTGILRSNCMRCRKLCPGQWCDSPKELQGSGCQFALDSCLNMAKIHDLAGFGGFGGQLTNCHTDHCFILSNVLAKPSSVVKDGFQFVNLCSRVVSQ